MIPTKKSRAHNEVLFTLHSNSGREQIQKLI